MVRAAGTHRVELTETLMLDLPTVLNLVMEGHRFQFVLSLGILLYIVYLFAPAGPHSCLSATFPVVDPRAESVALPVFRVQQGFTVL